MDNKKNGIPKLRFPGFTGAWEQRKLGEEFKRVNERNNGEFGKDRWISVAKMYFQDPDKVTSNNIDTRTYVMRFGDIAFEGHPNNEFKFGRFVANDIGDGVVSELFPIYRHIRDYDNNYWKYAIHLERIMGPIFAKSITSSGNSSNKLAPKDLLRQSIFLPHLDEQKQIGDFFKQLDSLITLHQRKLEHLQEQKKGLLQKMFPKNGETVPEVRFPGFTDAWEQRRLGEVAEIKTGSRNHQDSVDNGKYPFFVRSEKVERLNEYDFDTKAILVPGDGRIGEIFHYYDGKFALHQRVYKVDNFKEVNPLYLLNLFKYKFKKHALRLNAQGTVPSLRLPMFTNWNILIPNLNEQQKIGLFFQQLDSLITLHQRKLDHLELMKKGLLQQMFV